MKGNHEHEHELIRSKTPLKLREVELTTNGSTKPLA